MPITLPVRTTPDNRSLERTADKMERRLGKAGADAGKAFAKSMDSSASKADPKVLDKWTRKYDAVADAAGKVRAEEAKLDDLRKRGASNARIVSQAEALQRARRAETRATREAAAAYKDYERSVEQAGRTGLRGISQRGAEAGRETAEDFVSGFAGASALTRLASATGPVGLALAGIVGLGAVTGRKLVEQIEMGMASLRIKDTFAARIGLDGPEVGKFGSAAGKAYADAWGDSVEENLRIVQFSIQGGLIDTDATEADVQKLIEQIQSVSTLIGEDSQSIARGVRNFIRAGLVDSTEEALDLITVASQRGLNISGDLLDTFEEYGTKFRDLGLTGAEALGLISQFSEGAIRNTDVAADALKEFAIRAVDGSEASQRAFGALGFNADQLSKRFAAGGDSAKQAFGEVLTAINSIDDPLLQAQIGVALFGTKWEDAGDAIKGADLSGAARELGDIEGATQRATDKLEEHASSWGQLGRDIEQTFTRMQEWLADTTIGRFLGRDIPEFLSDLLTGGPPRGPGGPIPGAIPGTPYSGPGDLLGGGASTGGDPFANAFGDSMIGPGIFGDFSDNVRGTPGRGFPMPWNLGTGALPAAYEPGMVPNNVQLMAVLEKAFPGVKLSADTGRRDKYGEHGSGEALDIMVGNNLALGDKINQFLLANAEALGLSYTIWRQGQFDPGGKFTRYPDRGNPTQNHWDHVHARVRRGAATGMGARLTMPASGTFFSSNTVPMSPHGSGGGTPGYDDRGRAGVYMPDERAIRDARERVADVEEAIAEAKEAELEAQQRVLDAQVERAEIANDRMSLDSERRDAQKRVDDAAQALEDARKRTARLRERDLRNANESLADAERGRFQASPASRSPSGGMSMPGMIGAPVANDFGISGGLPGIASNLTTMLANFGFAPMIGALTGVKSVYDPFGTAGSGLMGIAGAMGGFGSGGFGTPAAMGGLGMNNIFGGPLGPAPGPTPSTVSGIAPAGGRGEGGLGLAGGLGGMLMSGLSAAAGAGGMAANAMAPGAGAAIAAGADIAIKLANRTAQLAGEVAGIGVGGLMETFLPVESSLADPMNSWFGRIVGGMIGAVPQLPNMAGGQAAAPNGAQPAEGQGGAPGNQIDVTYNNYQATEDRAGADLTNHLMAMNAGPGQLV